MKIVIDIPDEYYMFIKDLQFYHSGRRSGRTIERNVINAIKNGKPYEERPTGHWVIEECSLGKTYYCSECYAHPEVCFDFCPYCGADMRGDT